MRPRRTTVYGVDVRTEAGLDAILGPCRAVFGATVRVPLDRADPLSWPACPRCGARRAEPLVEAGHDCAGCFHGWIGRVLAGTRPFRRALPDDEAGAIVGWIGPAGRAP